MEINHIWIVFKKELKDIFRDKRTWIASVLIPVLVFPLMFFLMGIGQNNLEGDLAKAIPIAIRAADEEAELIDYLAEAEGLQVMDTNNPYEALEQGEIRVIVEIESGFDEKIQAETPAEVKLLFDEVSSQSSMSVAVVEGVLEDYNQSIRLERLAALGVGEEILEPTHIQQVAYVPAGQESKGESGIIMMMSFLLPYLLMLYPVVGGMPAAIDLGAGEKERLSLEPLLSTGADRLSILIGKYLTILVASVIGVITSIVGIFIAANFSPETIPLAFKLSPLSILIIIGVSLTLAMILSGVMLSISVFAKSYKEAGTYLSPVTIVLMVPTFLTMFMDLRQVPTGLFFIPLLNAVLLMKEALVQIINPLHILITFGVSGLLVIGTFAFTRYMFSKESVIFRS